MRSVLVAALLATPGLAADQRPLSLEYDVHYGPVPVIRVRTITELAPDRYHATAEMRTVGAIRFLFPWSTSSVISGVRRGDALQPLYYRATSELRGQPRLAEIAYADTAGPRVHVDPPPDADERDPVPAPLQADTIDPLTATLSALTSGCRGGLRVYDGRRRYDLALRDLGAVAVPSSRPLYTGQAQHCRAAITPLAGFWRPSARRGEQPTQIDFWLAAPQADVMVVPVYIELSAPAGTLAISLTGVERLSSTRPPG